MGQEQQGSGSSGGMVERALQLPLEVGVATSRTDTHYLEKRDKKDWWHKEAFPKVGVAMSGGAKGLRGAGWDARCPLQQPCCGEAWGGLQQAEDGVGVKL